MNNITRECTLSTAVWTSMLPTHVTCFKSATLLEHSWSMLWRHLSYCSNSGKLIARVKRHWDKHANCLIIMGAHIIIMWGACESPWGLTSVRGVPLNWCYVRTQQSIGVIAVIVSYSNMNFSPLSESLRISMLSSITWSHIWTPSELCRMLGASTNVPELDGSASNDWTILSSLILDCWNLACWRLRSRSASTSATLSRHTMYYSVNLQGRWTRG